MKRVLHAWLAAAVLLACATPPAPPPSPAPAAPAKAEAAPAKPSYRYRVTGAASAPALVLVHGNFDRLETWDAVVPTLAKAFRVVTLDLIGYGETPGPDRNYDSVLWANEVREILDAEGIQQAVLVGNSMGGAVVARFAIEWPERTAGLVFEDANFNSTSQEERARGPMRDLVQAAQRLSGSPEDPAAKEALRAAVAGALRVALRPEHVSDALIDHFAKGFDPPHFESMQRQRTYMEYRELPVGLLATRAKASFPILALWGFDDPLVPLEGGEEIRQQFPDSRLIVFGDCGHAPHLERPAEFASALISAFGPGGALPPSDGFVPGPSGLPDPTSERLADWPYSRLLLYRHAQAQAPSPASQVGIAEACAGVGDWDCARSSLPADLEGLPPAEKSRALFVKGRLALEGRDLAGAAESLTRSLGLQSDFSKPPRWQALGLLAGGLPLTAEQAKVVDARLFPAPLKGTVEPQELARARFDRLVSLDRYEDALAELDRSFPRVTFAPDRARRARALFGAGRLEEAADMMFDIDDQLGSYLRFGSPGTGQARRHGAMRTCLEPLAWAASIEVGLGAAVEEVECAPPSHALGDWTSDVMLERDLAALQCLAGTDDQGLRARLATRATEPWAALALAHLELRAGDPKKALKALDALPPEAIAQSARLARVVLGLRAEAKNPKAVADAARLAKAHPGSAAWQEVLAVALLASGKPAQARDLLRPLVEANPNARWLKRDLAAALALSGDLPAAKAAFAEAAPRAGHVAAPPRFAFERRAAELASK